MYIVTVDQGTSSTKTALWDSGGVPVAEATAAYDLERPDAVRAEIDPERWWDALCGTVAEVLAASGVPARDVAAVAVDGIGWTLVPVDDAFRPLAPAMTWLDRRAEARGGGASGRTRRRPAHRPRRQPARRRVHHAEARLAPGARAGDLRGDSLVPHRVRLPDRAVDGRGDLRPDPGLRLPLLRHPPRAVGRAGRGRARHPPRSAASAPRGAGDRGRRRRGRGRPDGPRAGHAGARRRARCRASARSVAASRGPARRRTRAGRRAAWA